MTASTGTEGQLVSAPTTLQDYIDIGLTVPSIGVQGLADAEHRGGAGFTVDPVGSKVVLTFAFLSQSRMADDPAPAVPGGNQDLLTSTFQAFDPIQQAAFVKAAKVWGDYANVELRLVEGFPADSYLMNGTEPGVNIWVGGFTTGTSFAFADGVPHGAAPDATYSRNLMFNLSSSSFDDAKLLDGGYGEYGFTTFLHELGHALGLEHPGNYDASDAVAPTFEDDATFREDNRALTIMSYFAEYYGGAHFGNENPSTPLAADIVAMRDLYGARSVSGPLNTIMTYGVAGNYEAMTIGGASDQLVGTIFDTHPVRLNFSPYSPAATIDLQQLAQSVGGLVNNLQIFETQVVEILTGSGNDTVKGDDYGQSIDGGAGHDLLDGRGGDDTLLGGIGNDTLIGGDGTNLLRGNTGNDVYVISHAGDTIEELELGGNDMVETTLSIYTLDLHDSFIENLSYIGDGDFIGVGNALANVVIGHTGSDTLDGMSGDDTLLGFGGDDSLVGGSGADLLNGAQGNDTLLGGGNNDSLLGGANADSLEGGTGQDTLEGESGNDTLRGGDDQDSLLGGDGQDELHGDAGADLLDGGEGNDLVQGGAGDDVIFVSAGDDTLEGGTGFDLLSFDQLGAPDGILLNLAHPELRSGFSSALQWLTLHDASGTLLAVPVNEFENFAGTAGNDTMIAGDQAVVLNGQAGNDRLSGFTPGVVLDGGLGTDTLDFSIYSFGVVLYVDMLTHVAEAQDASLLFLYSPVEFTGFENVYGLLSGGLGNYLYGDIEGNELEGGSGADLLDGRGGHDLLVGNGGQDQIFGHAGDDTVQLLVGDAVLGLAEGGDGSDRLVLQDVVGGPGFDFSFQVPAEGLHATFEGLSYSGFESVDLSMRSALTDGAQLTGGAQGDRFAGTAGGDTITGGGGNDSLYGLGGDDRFVIHAGDGIDQIDGGSGQDIVVFALSDNVAGVTIDLGLGGGFGGFGGGLVLPGGPPALPSGPGEPSFPVPILTSIETIEIQLGGGNDSVKGSTGRDVIAGGGGNDTIEGAGGPDLIQGGEGNDRLTNNAFYYEAYTPLPTVYVTLQGGAGDDTLQSSTPGSFDGGSGQDRLVYTQLKFPLSAPVNLNLSDPTATVHLQHETAITGIELFDMTMTDGADTVTVRYDAHHLDGWYGYDTLNVLLAPGQAVPVAVVVADFFGGDPTYTYANGMTVTGFEVINFISAPGTIGAGNDLVNGTAGADNLAGLGGNDTLLGGDGADTLDGGSGADSMVGGADNDQYKVDNAGDVVVELPGEGTEKVTATVSVTLWDNVENLVLGGQAAINGTGNGLANVITGNGGANQLDGAGGNDALNGGGGNDTLLGGEGNDTLNGEAGADSMAGGAGSDVYIVDNVGDLVEEQPGEGVDTILSSISLALAPNVEMLTLTGGAALNGTGNGLANTMTGNTGTNYLDGAGGNDTLLGGGNSDTLLGGEGDDSLDGGTGADSMVGGAGNDTYLVDDAGDVVTELAAGGVDSVLANASATLGAEVENLTLLGNAALNGIGNGLANTLTGNGGANQLDGAGGDDTLLGGTGNDTLLGGLGADSLDGGSGADSLAGGAGNDIYILDDAGDVVLEQAGEGTDRVLASVSTTLGAEVENLTLTGAGNINGIGNGLTNKMAGNKADNLLDGGGGTDVLNGGAGNDTLVGGAGKDILTGEAGLDAFRFNNLGDAGDTINDFGHGIDWLEFSAAGFGGGLSNGMDLAAAGRFVAGTVATQAGGQFLYNNASGSLYWDVDGTGGGAKVLVATLVGNPVVTAADLHIIG